MYAQLNIDPSTGLPTDNGYVLKLPLGDGLVSKPIVHSSLSISSGQILPPGVEIINPGITAQDGSVSIDTGYQVTYTGTGIDKNGNNVPSIPSNPTLLMSNNPTTFTFTYTDEGNAKGLRVDAGSGLIYLEKNDRPVSMSTTDKINFMERGY